MPYDLAEFLNCLPTMSRCIALDSQSEELLHAARWSISAFDSLTNFVTFTYRFSCVIQPFIFDSQRDDLDDWFYPDANSEDRAAEAIATQPLINQEAHQWMSRCYPSLCISWLNAGFHGKILSFEDGDWPEMVGYDTEGYFTVFVADAT